jgi:PAS domain S-box-containing protein
MKMKTRKGILKEAEEDVRRNGEKLQALMDASPMAIFWADMNGNIEYNNRKFRELFGYTVEDIPTIAEWRRLAYPDPAYRETIPSLVVMLTEAQKQGKVVTPIEVTVTCKDGSPRYVEQMGAFASNRILAIYNDLTEHKRVEEALRESEEKYRTILEDIEEGYFETDLVGNLTYINDAGCRHLGYTREELIGMNNRQYVDEKNAKKIFEAFNQIYRTGEPGRVFDYELTRKDGTKRQVEMSASLRKDSSAKPIGFRGVTRDITERKQAEEALRQSEERYRTILENMQEVYYEIDLAGNFIFLNEAFYEHLGYRKEEMIGQKSRQYQDETTARKLQQAYNRLYRTGEPIKAIEAEWISKDGAKRTREMSASLIRDSEGKPIGFRGISRDVTERKRAEEALKKSEEELRASNEELRATEEELRATNEELQTANEELQAANEKLKETQEQLIRSEKLAAIGKLAGGVGHELRNPLGAIKNAVYYIKGKLINSELAKTEPRIIEFLGIMDDEISSSNKIINDLLNFSRVAKPAVSPTKIQKVMEDALSRLTVHENVEVINKVDANLPEVEIDADQIRQVFVNIATNAIQAMPEGGKLTIDAKKGDKFLEVAISDTGDGIPEDAIGKIFDPLFTTRAKGIGLGLAVCKSIIERHGGAIGVESKVGEGATFTVKLPLKAN